MKSTKPIETGPESKPTLTVYSTPREKFQANSTFCREHRDLVDSTQFNRGADAALCDYAVTLAASVQSADTAMSAGFRLKGAVDYISKLKGMGELQQMPVKRPDPDNLKPTDQPKRL